ncbi:MAG TPA: DUF4870 domain-containing protein [Pyrinomonadaceae bacterium]|jgi:uncharacterized membrane protein|nr:DUF4870 domain-containing protein [Pyrinomonadaceae bacterium]
MQNPPPVQTAPAKSSTGLDENIAALLSYVFGWVSGLIFFLIEKDSRLVRFHAMQSLLFNVLVGIIATVLWVILFVFFLIASQVSGVMTTLLTLVSTLIWIVLLIAILVGWVMCLIKAYGSQYFKLPVIGNFAEKFSQK